MITNSNKSCWWQIHDGLETRKKGEVKMDGQDDIELQNSLTTLKMEHRQIDEEIRQLLEAVESDQLRISRMKKKKLTLKDEIRQLEDRLMPDIIA